MKLSVESLKPVMVDWLDPVTYNGWYGSGDDVELKPVLMESLGWLLHQSDDVVVIAMSVCEMKVGNILVIPTPCVMSIVKV